MKKSGLFNQTVKKIVPWLLPVLVLWAWQLSSMVGILSNKILPAPLDAQQHIADAFLKAGLIREPVSVRDALLE